MFKFINQKIAKMSVLALAAVLISFSVSAQTYVTDESQLDISLTPGNVDVIKIGDLIKLAPGQGSSNSRILYSAVFTNKTNQPIYIKAGQLKFYGTYNGVNLGITLENKNLIKFEANQSVQQSSNTITNSKWIEFGLSKGSEVDINTIAKAFGKKASDFTTASPVPSGEYTFYIALGDIITRSATLNLTNVESNVTLIGPGDELGSDIPEIDDKQPLITWTGGSPTYDVVVVEKTETENSLGDLLSKVPNFRDQTQGTSLKYPSAGVKPLQPGKVYVVAVASIVKDFGSTTPVRKWSTPFIFKIREQQTGGQSAGNQIVDTFKSAFGDQYNAAFDQLTNGKPTGNMTLDDKPISVNDLRNIVAKLQNQEYTLKGISVK